MADKVAESDEEAEEDAAEEVKASTQDTEQMIETESKKVEKVGKVDAVD